MRAIVATQAALKADVSLARKVADRLFPPREAALIERLVDRDLPFYDANIPPALVEGMNGFAMRAGLLDAPAVLRKDMVAEQFAAYWMPQSGA